MVDAWRTVPTLPGGLSANELNTIRTPILRDAKQQQVPTAYARPTTFANNWTDYAAGYATVGYLLTPDGWVSIKGRALRASGTPTTSETIFVLPPGLRPSAQLPYAVATGDNTAVSVHGQVDVAADGRVIWVAGQAATAGQCFVNLNLPLFRPV